MTRELNTEPLISIIIPCYNYAHFLNDCFINLSEQSHTNWECLIIDNNSTDNTKQVVLDFIEKDKRFSYHFQPIKGPSAARNLGIELAKGDFIQFLDADDLLALHKFKNALSIFAMNNELDIVYSGMRYFPNENPSEYYYSMRLDKSTDKEWMCYAQGGMEAMLPHLLKENIMVISSPLIKASSLKEIGLFDTSLAYNEDWELWLRFAFANKQFAVDKDANSFALIRVHKTSHSNNAFKMFLAGIKIGFRYENKISNLNLKKQFQHKTDYAIFSLERILFQRKKDEKYLTEVMPLLVDVVPFPRFIKWNNLINHNKWRVLRINIIINYIFRYLKFKV